MSTRIAQTQPRPQVNHLTQLADTTKYPEWSVETINNLTVSQFSPPQNWQAVPRNLNNIDADLIESTLPLLNKIIPSVHQNLKDISSLTIFKDKDFQSIKALNTSLSKFALVADLLCHQLTTKAPTSKRDLNALISSLYKYTSDNFVNWTNGEIRIAQLLKRPQFMIEALQIRLREYQKANTELVQEQTKTKLAKQAAGKEAAKQLKRRNVPASQTVTQSAPAQTVVLTPPPLNGGISLSLEELTKQRHNNLINTLDINMKNFVTTYEKQLNKALTPEDMLEFLRNAQGIHFNPKTNKLNGKNVSEQTKKAVLNVIVAMQKSA